MDVVEIYLKSGHTITVSCEEWRFDFDKYDCKYTGYKFKGIKHPHQVGFVPSQMIGYAVVARQEKEAE